MNGGGRDSHVTPSAGRETAGNRLDDQLPAELRLVELDREFEFCRRSLAAHLTPLQLSKEGCSATDWRVICG